MHKNTQITWATIEGAWAWSGRLLSYSIELWIGLSCCWSLALLAWIRPISAATALLYPSFGRTQSHFHQAFCTTQSFMVSQMCSWMGLIILSFHCTTIQVGDVIGWCWEFLTPCFVAVFLWSSSLVPLPVLLSKPVSQWIWLGSSWKCGGLLSTSWRGQWWRWKLKQWAMHWAWPWHFWLIPMVATSKETALLRRFCPL